MNKLDMDDNQDYLNSKHFEWVDKEIWIILYLQDTEGWIGAFPSNIWQWVVMEYQQGPPLTFTSKKQAVDYIVHECLTPCGTFSNWSSWARTYRKNYIINTCYKILRHGVMCVAPLAWLVQRSNIAHNEQSYMLNRPTQMNELLKCTLVLFSFCEGSAINNPN